MTRHFLLQGTVSVALLVLAGEVAGQAAAAAVPTDEAEASASITAEHFHHRVRVLAHDSMRGRDTPSPELEKAARWIAAEFQALGLRPGGDRGSFLQRYAIRHAVPDVTASRVRVVGGAELLGGRDLGLPFGISEDAGGTAPLVVVSGARDWAEALARTELEGRHVVLVTAPGPQGAYALPARQMIQALRAAGVASVLVATDRAERDWARGVALQEETVQVHLPWRGTGAPVLEVRDGALQAALQARGVDVAALRARSGDRVQVRPARGVTLEVDARTRVVHEETAPNVVGILPGGDPRLQEEHVVFSAHMDHVGVGAPDATGDSIYNGADDNASGTAAVMALADAFARLGTPPRRSVVFVLVSGEEKGLWGSEYFAGHAPMPARSMVANFNLDMVGRNWPDTIVAIGKEHSDLGETLQRVNDRHPELDMTAIDDLWPAENFYFRSDHYNFARRGVPILFFFNGTHADYHRPGDTPDKIDAEKASRVARLVFHLGLEVANADHPPRWNPDSYRRIVDREATR